MKISLIYFLLALLFFSESYGQKKNVSHKLLDSVSTLLNEKQLNDGKQILDKLHNEYYTTASDSFKMQLLERTAFYYFLQGDYENVVFNALKASEFAQSLGYRKLYFDMKNNVGAIFSKLDEFDKAYLTYKEILEESTIEEDTLGYISTLSNLGSALSALKKIDSSNKVLNNALALTKISNNKELEASITKFIAKNNLELKLYNKVIENVNYLENKLWDELRVNQQDDALYYRSNAFLKLNKLDLALTDINNSLTLARAQKFNPAVLDGLNVKAEIFAAQGKFENAFKIQQELTKLSDSIDIQSSKEKVLELERKYETEKKEKENAQLKAEGFNKDLTISQKNNLILILIAITTSILILMVLWQLRKFKIKNKQLKALIAQTVRLQKELDVVRENIAKDFHDDLGNKLARITTISDYVLKRSESKNKDDMLDAFEIIKQDADELYDGTRDFMFSLNSNSDMAEATFSYLADFANEYVSGFDIDLHISSDIENDKLLPKYWNRQIILIFKEAITNAVKYSSAANVYFKFNYPNDHLLIELNDDGCGFDYHNTIEKEVC